MVEAVVLLNVIVYDSVSIEDGDDVWIDSEVSELLRSRARVDCVLNLMKHKKE